jgi:hypothetical protein
LFNISTNNATANPYGFALVNSGPGGVGLRMCNSLQSNCGTPGTGSYWQIFDAATTGNLKIGQAFVGDFLVMSGAGDVSVGGETPTALFNVGASNQFQVGADGGTTIPYQLGPATAPSGACAVKGAWVFSQDGHGTFCNAGTWVTKI